MIRVLVTGSRTWDDGAFVWSVLDAVLTGGVDITVVHGACPKGADQHAAEWCRETSGVADNQGYVVAEERFPADWAKYGRSAGIRRNEQMVKSGVDLCLAFIRDNSKGASHCARIAEAAEIETRIFRWEDR